jgi:hypothetical protein
LSPFSGKSFHPFSEGGIGEVEGFRSRFDGVTRNHLPDGLGTAKDTGFLGLFHQVS